MEKKAVAFLKKKKRKSIKTKQALFYNGPRSYFLCMKAGYLRVPGGVGSAYGALR